MTVTLPLPFRSSRQLGHGNAVLGQPGVVLELVGLDLEPELHADWRRRIERVAAVLGWPAPSFAGAAASGAHSLGFTAPCHQLQTAREANEWALCAAVQRRDPSHWGALRIDADEVQAIEQLRRRSLAEAQGLQPA